MLKQAKNILLKTEVIMPGFIVIGLVLFMSLSTVLASGISPQEVIALTNQSRTAAGLTVLSENKYLSQAASDKAEDMINNDYFAHTSPTGVGPWHWFKTAGYNYKYAGENLAVNYTNAEEQDSAWMKSETHRANILNPRYQDIGVAVVAGKVDGKETLITVELFGAPFVAVADQMVAPPLWPKELAAVKGVETEALPQSISWAEKIAAVFPAEKIGWLDFGILLFVALLAFSTLIAPLAFLVQAYGGIISLLRARNAEITVVMEGV